MSRPGMLPSRAPAYTLAEGARRLPHFTTRGALAGDPGTILALCKTCGAEGCPRRRHRPLMWESERTQNKAARGRAGEGGGVVGNLHALYPSRIRAKRRQAVGSPIEAG